MAYDLIERLRTGRFTLMAEIGVNYYDIAAKLHISPMEAAKYMILAAANAGIHAVKFQTYKAETLASKYSPSYWDTSEEPTTSQYELFKKFDSFGADEYRELSHFAAQTGVEFCSTPFDFDSADYLAEMMQVYKISSSDLTNLPFIEHMAKKGQPILLSVGAANLDEIERAVAVIRTHNDRELVLLHCVLEYPTPQEHANLAKIRSLREHFPDAYIGYSDHTKPDMDVIKTAYLLGATLVEKHFTVDKTLVGNDHYHAMDPHDAEEILRGIAHVDTVLGSGELAALPTEAAARQNARRSIVARVHIPAGTSIRADMLTCKRPGTGIPPARMEELLGRVSAVDIAEDSILQEEMFEGGVRR